MSLVSEFKEFVLRGNVVDLAVGVVVGGAFGTLVKAFTTDLIDPLLAVFLPKGTKFLDFAPTIGNSVFPVGNFIDSVIAFLLMAFVVFIFVVKPLNYLSSLKKSQTPEPETTRECPDCLSKIPLEARRCAFCTSVVAA